MPAATILGLSPYFWLMIIFLVLLIIVLVLGHDFDVDHSVDIGHDIGHGLSPLSLPIIALFGTTFGGVGAILDYSDLPVAVVILVASVVAALMAAGMWFVMVRLFVRSQSSSDVILESLVGRQANATIPIAPGETGQVLVITAERGRTLLPAISSEEVRTDDAVVIDGVVGNVLRVRKVV